MDADRKMLTANIEIKITVDGKQWYVAASSANIENKDLYTIPPGEVFPSSTSRSHRQ